MLFLVATPIGNLGDITLRAIDTLQKVDYVASEDTRKTGLLLKHLGIDKKPQVAFHEYNEQKAGEKIIRLLEEGKSVALVTNAGTPGISDPGFSLVRRALAASIPISAVPGPTAFVMALVLSGLPVHNFTFRGFPPHKAGARRKYLAADLDCPHTLIYYESSHRVKEFLQDALEIFGDRRASLANDLTKFFERVERGSLSEIIEAVKDEEPKGEYTVVIEGRLNTQAS
jgi:16S rRNA (cytidine1402-2'-O)-methyltransferase